MISRSDLLKPGLKENCDLIVLKHPAVTVSGPGQIWRSAEGDLCYQIHASSETYDTFSDWASKAFSAQEKVVPADRQFALEATLLNGDLLRSNSTLPFRFARGENSSVFIGKLAVVEHVDSITRQIEESPAYIDRLKRSQADPARGGEIVLIETVYGGVLDFPFNEGTSISKSVAGQPVEVVGTLNALRMVNEEYKFTMFHDGSSTVVRLELPRRLLGIYSSHRVHEALQFALGRRVALIAAEVDNCVTQRTMLFPGVVISSSEGRSPVYSKRDMNDAAAFSDLFLAYFSFVNREHSSFCHPISAYALSGVEVDGTSIEVEIMSLAVGIEGILKTKQVPGADYFPDSELVDAVERVQSFVGEQKFLKKIGESTIGGVISSKLGQLKDTAPVQRLRAFLGANQLDPKMATRWHGIRGKYTHATRVKPELRPDAETDYAALRTMMHVIVFRIIGYAGPYLNYTTGVRTKSVWK